MPSRYGDVFAVDEAQAHQFVTQCAYWVGCAPRPSPPPNRIIRLTVQRLNLDRWRNVLDETRAVVWVVSTTLDGEMRTYRFLVRKVTFGDTQAMSLDNLATLTNGSFVEVLYLNVPGNVLDLGFTAGRDALGLRKD
jgi:hypothetical protein